MLFYFLIQFLTSTLALQLTEQQKMEEGKRMFSIFAARMFEQRVLTAYREKVAQERQLELLREEEAEKAAKKEREAKKAKENQKKKDKKKCEFKFINSLRIYSHLYPLPQAAKGREGGRKGSESS